MQNKLLTTKQASLITGYSSQHLRKTIPSFEVALGNGKKMLHLYDEEQIKGIKKKGFKNLIG